MIDLLTPALAIAAVKFKWQKEGDAKTYDYIVPAGLELSPGDKVIVETKKGDTEVIVVEIKTESEMATKPILRRAPDPVVEEPKAEVKQGWDF